MRDVSATDNPLSRLAWAYVLTTALLITVALGCGRRLPSVSGPSPTVSPAPGQLAPKWRDKAILSPLRANGNRFSRDIVMAIPCCADPFNLIHKWPLSDEYLIKLFSENGVNAIHIRPTTSNAPWPEISSVVETALRYGVYVEVDVLDGWAARNQNGWPWIGESCDTLQEAPRENHRRFIRDLVQATGRYPNVFYLVGNETSTCGVSEAWETGVRDLVVEALQDFGFERKLIGTNSERLDWERKFDYYTSHNPEAQVAGSVPRLTNEYNDRTSTFEHFKAQFERAQANGTYYALWRGLQSDAEWEKSLAYLRERKK